METIREFNAQMRCDRCGSQAYHAATKNEHELLFCAHHLNKFHNALLADSWEIETDVTGLESIGVPAEVG